MSTTKSIYLSLLLLASGLAGARGESVRTDINPALQYYQAYLLAPDFSPADRDYLFANDWRGQKLPERFGELLSHYDNQFRLVRQAAQATVACDWGLDISPGPGTLMPHLARNKGIAQAARLRAQWALQQGRQAEARDDLLAAFTLGRNCSRDGTLISTLVQIAVENIVCSTVAENFHLFTPETLKQLADGIEAAPARTTMAACLPTEKAFFSDWLLRNVLELQKENRGNDAKVMAKVHELIDGMVGGGDEQATQAQRDQAQREGWGQLTRAAGGTSEGIVKLLRGMEPMYEKAAVVLASPPLEYEEQVKQFNAEIEQSQNPLVALAFPAIGKARPKELAILAKLAMVRAAVEYKVHGEAGFRSVTDPCGQGPFAYERFVFDGKDRGIELKSAYSGRGFQEVLVFVEKEGPAFRVEGKDAGQAVPRGTAAK
jgi:hypothetical protein